MGEVRRHFRDNTWAVRVPRRTKDLQQLLGPATETLTHRLGRAPRARELAAELDADLIEITNALIARNAYQATPIDATTSSENDSAPPSLLDRLGTEDPRYGLVEDFLAVQPLIAALPDRERLVLNMRFFEFRTQAEIAQHLGISQMQVSRILSKTLSTLREQVSCD